MSSSTRLEIAKDGVVARVREIDPGIYSIGSEDDNTIVLPGPEISGRHAILIVRENGIWVEDLSSRTGTAVGDESVHGRSPVAPGAAIRIGRFSLTLRPRPPPTPP